MADNEWKGLDEAMRKMRTLGPKLAQAPMRRTGTKAMKPVRDAARAGATRFDDPATASNIASKIVTRSGGRRADRAERGVVTKVGVMGGAKAYRDNSGNRRLGRVGQSYSVDDPNSFHWRFLEFGTRHMRAQPFMRPALEQNTSLVTQIYSASLSAEIDKEIRKRGL